MTNLTSTPKTARIKTIDIEMATAPISDDMTLGHYKAIEKARKKVEGQIQQAAARFLKEELDVDIQKRIPHWRSFSYESQGKLLTGKVVIIEYLHDERSPAMVINTWSISKRSLVKKYAR